MGVQEMQEMQEMEFENNIFQFTSNEQINGLVINLIDNEPYSHIDIEIWIGKTQLGLFDIPHYIDVNDDCFGRNTSIYRILLIPFKTTETIKVKVKTKIFKEHMSMYLLTQMNEID